MSKPFDQSGIDAFEFELEQAVDAWGVETVLASLAKIMREKSEHIESSYSDRTLAKAWAKQAAKVEKLSATL